MHASQSKTAVETAAGTVRYKVVGFALLLAGVTYLDRVCISVLAPSIMRDLGLTQIQMSWVFSAFAIAYAAFEIPTAWWAERIGSRAVLTRIVTWWSAFTLMTAAAFNYVSLLAIRFLFGAGEAGAWPNAARVFSRWIPARERGKVQGVFFASAHLAGGITPLLVAQLAGFLSWRAIFLVFGCIGFIWAIAWHRWFRDEPRDHPAVGAAEAAMIEAERGLPASHHGGQGAWKALTARPSTFLLCLMYFSNSYGFYFLITWLPTYLAKVRGFSSVELSLFAGLPLLLSVIADIGGGWTTDKLTATLGVRAGRCVIGCAAYAAAGVAMMSGAAIEDPRMGAVLIAVASASSMFTLAPSWASCIDIGRKHSGLLSAAMNTSGQVGAILSPIILAYVVDRFDNWAIPLYLMAGLYFMASICWIFIRPDRPVAE
jgi:MFS family permease